MTGTQIQCVTMEILSKKNMMLHITGVINAVYILPDMQRCTGFSSARTVKQPY